MHFNGLKSFLCHFCINLSSGSASIRTCLPKLAFLKKCPEKGHTLWTLSFQNISINMRTSRKHGTPDPICSEAAPADRSVVSASLIDWLIDWFWESFDSCDFNRLLCSVSLQHGVSRLCTLPPLTSFCWFLTWSRQAARRRFSTLKRLLPHRTARTCSHVTEIHFYLFKVF